VAQAAFETLNTVTQTKLASAAVAAAAHAALVTGIQVAVDTYIHV